MAEEVPPDADAAASSFADDVGASVIVEAGATSGTLTLPASAMKFADLTESGSESGDNEAGSGSGSGEPGTSAAATGVRSSPPPNCAICLSRCHRKCFTDSCMHQFCFKCLCEWSKVKAECPLCKQRFKTIIHNVRTLDDYDRYPVQTSSPSQPDHSAMRFHIVRRPRFMPLVQNQAVMTNDIEAGLGAGGAAAGAGGVLAAEDVLPAVEASGGRHTYNRFEPYRWELMNFYRHDQDAATAGSSSLIQLWRRYVYDRKLYALPVSDSLTGHFREWSARFYRNNPAQMHRLMPWIQRDIVCLLRNAAHSVGTVMQLMHDILPMTNILGPTFRRRLSPFLGDRTSHFIHELFNFARSPFDMIGYDHVVQYSARVAEEVEVDLLDMVETQSSNESDLHLEVGDGGAGVSGGDVDGEAANAETSSNAWSNANEGGSGGRPSTSVIVTNPSATHSFSVSLGADGSEHPGISVRRTASTSNVGSQTVAINLSMRRPAPHGEVDAAEIIEIDDGDAAANAEVAAINDGSNPSRRNAGASLPVSAHIELGTSSSSGEEDECVFVLELKAPHLRTPEQVSLDSNSDSDVVFVNEENEAPAAANNSGDQEAIDQAIMSSADQSARPSLFMGPSTSAAATRGKNWKLLMAEARRQDQMRTTRSSRSKRTRQRRSSVPARWASPSDNSSSGTSSTAGWTTSSDEESSSNSCNAVSAKKKPRKALPTRKGAGKSPRSKGKSVKRRVRPAAGEAGQDQTPVEPALAETREMHRAQGPQVGEQQQEQQQPSSSASCSSCGDESDSSQSSDPPFPSRLKDKTSSEDSDDDSTENLQLSALRATLKAEATLEDRKPLKQELLMPDEDDADVNHDDEEQQQQQPPPLPPNEDDEEEDQQPQPPLPDEEDSLPQARLPSPTDEAESPGCSAPKRRRSCSDHSNLSSQSVSLASSSATATTSSSGPLSSFNWRAASYGSDPLMREALPLEDEDDMAPSLIDVALNFLRHERTGGYGLESESAMDAVEDPDVETAEDTATADEDEDEDEEEDDDAEADADEEEHVGADGDLAENIHENDGGHDDDSL